LDQRAVHAFFPILKYVVSLSLVFVGVVPPRCVVVEISSSAYYSNVTFFITWLSIVMAEPRRLANKHKTEDGDTLRWKNVLQPKPLNATSIR
jgi:hypothetical protein